LPRFSGFTNKIDLSAKPGFLATASRGILQPAPGHHSGGISLTLTESDLQQIMPTLPPERRQLYLPFINMVMEVYEIDTPLRASAFLAQIAHESAELRFMEEIWGPTAQQKKYEPPSDVATRLGNTQPGDGFRYRGRGPIQITGRSNYQTFGGQLGVDLVGNPDLAATPQIAFSTAGLFWKMNGLNELADVEDFIAITRRINGGLNGLADRQKYYEIAKELLGAEEPGHSVPDSER